LLHITRVYWFPRVTQQPENEEFKLILQQLE
jgi:hypothetical protein